MSKRKCLFSENPIIFGPSLAVLVGVDAAIVLQRLEFITHPDYPGGRIIDGDKWVWNTYKTWREKHFPFWSERHIQRIIQFLEDRGWILSKQPDGKISRKKYYRLSNAFKERATLEAAAEHAKSGGSDAARNGGSQHAKIGGSVTESTTESPQRIHKGGTSAPPCLVLRKFSDKNPRPHPTSEEEMYELLETLDVATYPSHDGQFFDDMRKTGWRIRGKKIADWVLVYEARTDHTVPGNQ